VQRLQQAIGVVSEPRRRAELALAQGHALHGQQRFGDAAEVLSAAIEAADPDLADELEAAYISSALFVAQRSVDARARAEQLEQRIAGEPRPFERHALAHLALYTGLHGGGRAEVLRLTELVWRGVPLGPGARDVLSLPLLMGALVFVDELERALELCDAALRATRLDDSPALHALVSFCRAWPLYGSGRIVEAATAAQAALDGTAPPWHSFVRTAYGAVACCHIETGQLEQAETALSIIEHPDVGDTPELGFLLDVRAQLRLAQLRPAAALEDAREAGAQLERRFGMVSPGVAAWRSTAALAHLALGDAASARELASQELEQARAAGVTRVVIRDLRVLGLVERGERGLELLEQAVEAGDRYPPRLEHLRALIDLGAALRRANRRAAAREPLRRALELSHSGGATALDERTRSELAAAGARPRRAMLSGIESLTPSERRVAEVAAKGLTTRQIAETLFVSPKTVEFHLRHIYQKLDIASRSELTKLLEDDGSAG
jgi:DNA-binding CsgD family transcriptional regulator